MVTSYSDPICWVEQQVEHLIKLNKIFYETDTSNITFENYVKVQKSLQDAKEKIASLKPIEDIDTGSNSVIFGDYYKDKSSKTFEEYFNKNLNPDTSTPGFLEELDGLVQLTRVKTVIIKTDGTDTENSKAKVLSEYLASIPPF